jgi:Xaa-Pro aminopeptidase
MNLNIKRILDHMQDQSIAIVFSGTSPIKTADQTYPFQVSKNFFYATHINEEDLALMIIKGNTTLIRLYSLIKTPIQEKWEGKRPTFESLKKQSEIEDIKDLATFEDDLKNILSLGRDAVYGDIKHIYIDFSVKERLNTYELQFTTRIMPLYPDIRIENLGDIFRTLRMMKSSDEVTRIKRAIDITNDALDVVLKDLKHAKNERDVHALFQYELFKKGSREAFDTIAASGLQATVLHYHDNNKTLDQNALILLDLGATYHEYNADISRTYPVSGVFSERQKVLYQMVLDVNKEMIDWIKPGKTMAEFKEAGKALLAKKAIEIGLIDQKEDIIKYYYHGLGHHLGLDVHDLSDQQKVFTEGMVITVEPGIYIEEESIGIRIEDDCLITKDGVINLSSHIIKEIKDIEEKMK